jgi:hypothetical protein
MAEMFRAAIDFTRAYPLTTILIFGVVTWAILYTLWRRSR